jgi:hypothetical protein
MSVPKEFSVPRSFSVTKKGLGLQMWVWEKGGERKEGYGKRVRLQKVGVGIGWGEKRGVWEKVENG